MGSKGWEGYSSIGIGVSDVKGHGSFVLVVGEKEDLVIEGVEMGMYEYGTFANGE